VLLLKGCYVVDCWLVGWLFVGLFQTERFRILALGQLVGRDLSSSVVAFRNIQRDLNRSKDNIHFVVESRTTALHQSL